MWTLGLMLNSSNIIMNTISKTSRYFQATQIVWIDLQFISPQETHHHILASFARSG